MGTTGETEKWNVCYLFINVTFLGCGDNTAVKMENVLFLRRSVLKYLGIRIMMSSTTKKFMLYACVWVCAGGRERKKRSKCGKMVTTVEFR